MPRLPVFMLPTVEQYSLLNWGWGNKELKSPGWGTGQLPQELPYQ